MWRIDFIIPNFEIEVPFENEYFSITSTQDSRVQEIFMNHENVKVFINSFRDQFQNKINPSLFLSKVALPDHLKSIDAIVGFRNILAISAIIQSYEKQLVNDITYQPPFSEHFDFYEYLFAKDQDEILIDTPGVKGLVSDMKNVFGQTHPGLAKHPNKYNIEYDILLELIKQIWERRYKKNKLSEWKTKTIFRALEMAYLACRMPNENLTTIFDIGTKIALWVSAFEILAHPYSTNVNVLTVINCIDNYDWNSKILKPKRYKIKYNGEHRVTLLSKIYKQLYDSRNYFLHGNDTDISKINVFYKKNNVLLTNVAPLIFKIALLSKFFELFPNKIIKKEKDLLESNLVAAFSKCVLKKEII